VMMKMYIGSICEGGRKKQEVRGRRWGLFGVLGNGTELN
jgi:hypothetical protein